MINRGQELWDWLHTLDAQFAFLLVLPFLVALAAFVGEGVRRLLRRDRKVRQVDQQST